MWPYPGGRLAYIFTVIFAVNIAIAGFLLLRRVKNVGYSIGWDPAGRSTSSARLACLRLHRHSRSASNFTSSSTLRTSPNGNRFLPLSVAILCFTAWPEEFLFRGLLQNLLSRSTSSETVGWITASILFGFSHITNMHFPNWRYVLLATIAGLFYGWTWRKTGSIFASAIVHAAVDILWHLFFITP